MLFGLLRKLAREKKRENLSDDELMAIAGNVRVVKNVMNSGQLKNYYENTRSELLKRGEFPKPMVLVEDKGFLEDLAYHRQFWKEAGISYSRVDDFWDAVRAGFAQYCLRQDSRKG
jgi:hypothetical protein